MKTKSKLLISSIAMSAALMLSACNSAAENVTDAQNDVNEANEALDLANEEYLEDIANFKIETGKAIAINDSLILDLKAKSKVSGKQNNPYYENEIADLERRNAELKLKMDEYKGDGKDNWTEFKEEFNHDMDELGNALKDLTENNKE